MTSSISHRLYQQIILLYPEPFRREFGEEMLSVFDECQPTRGIAHLLADRLVAALKQQVRYLTIHAPDRTALYAEIASSSALARRLALAVVAVAIVAGVFGREGRPNKHAWATVRVEEHQIWHLQCSNVAICPTSSTSKPHQCP